MKTDIDANKFIEAIAERPCCATCKFFVSDNLLSGVRDRVGSNRIWGMEISGTCQRFPRQVTKQGRWGDDLEDSEWGHPEVRVVATEWSQEDGSFYLVEGKWEFEFPWCGEHVDYEHGFESYNFLNPGFGEKPCRSKD